MTTGYSIVSHQPSGRHTGLLRKITVLGVNIAMEPGGARHMLGARQTGMDKTEPSPPSGTCGRVERLLSQPSWNVELLLFPNW